MFSFITGSRAYGLPHAKSDIDLVIRVNTQTACKLREFAGAEDGEPVRFGKLNLILCETDEEWATWRIATSDLVRRGKPVSREEAKQVLDILRAAVGISDGGDSGEPK